MDLNELIEAAADAWDEPTYNLTIEGDRSQRNADQCAARARILAERAEKLDPNYHQWVRVDGAA